MLVTDPLLIDTDTFDGEYSILLSQPSCIELIVWHDEEEDDANGHRQTASEEKDDFPRRNRRSVFVDPSSDAIGYKSAEDLSKAVERKPDSCPTALFLLCIPLGSEKRESWCHRSFKDSQEYSDHDRALVVLDSRETCQRQAPEDDVDSTIFGQW